MLRTAKSLEGYELRARDGTIGSVKDIYFDDEKWRVRYLVVATGSWLTGRSVLIAAAALTARDWDKRALVVDLTKEQVRESPSVDTNRPVSRQQEEELHRYYAWPYYWTAPLVSVGYVAPIPPETAPAAAAARDSSRLPEPGEARRNAADDTSRSAQRGDPHLRSAHAVRGQHIEAADGSIGHVADFLIEDSTWDVRFLLVDTRNWLPGKKVIVSPARIRDIDWLRSTVRIDLTRDAIQSGPEFDESRPVSADYIDRLEAHYGRMRGPHQ
jgi:uncharacterized protein YrrD